MSQQQQSFPKSGIDLLLSQHGKTIQPGQQVTFTLIKGKSGVVAVNPVNSKAPPETFPLVAKFPESVPKPNFTNGKAHLYQQDAPKVQVRLVMLYECMECMECLYEYISHRPHIYIYTLLSHHFAVGRLGWRRFGCSGTEKKWKRRPQKPQRQWILQEETEFLETMMAKRQKKALPTIKNNKDSSRYLGVPEHNPSHYCLLSATSTTSTSTTVQVTTLTTPHVTTTFSQPRQGMSLSQAEQAITDQRAHMSQYMMHSHLMGKLQDKDDQEDHDDVMANVAFSRKKKRATSSARRELLQDQDDIQVDEDGVLGGTNDAEFGGKCHFGHYKGATSKTASTSNNNKMAGNDGMAMSDDFYQWDVLAEYEDLDYDANEQFEDDDVDMGEKEVHLSAGDGGFADPDSEEEDDEVLEDTSSGAEGLATLAGFKKLLAKARGQTADPLEVDSEGEKKSSRPTSPTTAAKSKAEPTVHDPLANLLSQAETVAQQEEPPVKKQKVTRVELDKQGRRVLSLEAVQREIWLNHGSIPVKRISKTFGVKAKDKERYNEFVQIAKTLATFDKDELGNAILVLKQHYKIMA